MSTEQNAATPRPDTHWHAHCPDAACPPHEMVISPHQAVCEALAVLGQDAPAADVRRHLAQQGVDVEESLIEDVRKELPGSCPAEG